MLRFRRMHSLQKFASIHASFHNLFNDIADIISGTNDNGLVPDLSAGLDGMWFITSCIDSSNANGSWIKRY